MNRLVVKKMVVDKTNAIGILNEYVDASEDGCDDLQRVIDYIEVLDGTISTIRKELYQTRQENAQLVDNIGHLKNKIKQLEDDNGRYKAIIDRFMELM